jgi:hypothetical protein
MAKPHDTPAKKPGRKAETPAQRLERLERDLQAARRAVKQAEHRTFATVGAAVLAEAHSDEEFKTRLRDILRRHVESKTGKADIAPLLAE